MPRSTREEHRDGEINSRNQVGSRSDGLRTKVDAGMLKMWINQQLNEVGGRVEDLCVDLRNGRIIILLLETLSGEQIPKKGGRLRVHMLENLRTIMIFLKRRNIDTMSIREEDILDGDLNATTILMSTILLHFQKIGRTSTEDHNTRMYVEGNTEVRIAVQRGSTGHINSKGVGAVFRGSGSCASIQGHDTVEEWSSSCHLQREAVEPDKIISFWKTRMESLEKFVLPFYKCSDEVEPKWEMSAWSPPLMSEEMGDAKRVLLDAFLIYLARVVGEARLHVGWSTPKTKATRNDPDSVIPMAISVWLDEPWSSISNAVDNELSFLSNYDEIPLDVTSQRGTRDSKTTWLPEIVVSVTNREMDSRDSRAKGKALTLEIDDSGHYRWTYDERRVQSNIVGGMGERLKHLVNALLTAQNDDMPIYKLIVKVENEHGLFLRDWVASKETRPIDIDHQLFQQQVLDQCTMRCKNSVASTRHSLFYGKNPSDDRCQKQQDHKALRSLMTPHATKLTPDLLPLISLTQADIDYIIGEVPEGLANIQDIYALTPLQDSVLFHNTLSDDDGQRSLTCQIAFADRSLLERYLHAVQRVIQRHDILRTAFIWENISTPAQVVLRQVPLKVAETTSSFHPNKHAIDLNEAPLIRYVITRDVHSGWILHELIHPLIMDQTTLEIFHTEVQTHMNVQENYLPSPAPFRNVIAEIQSMNHQEEGKHFFTSMLAGIEEPTLLFGPAEIDRRSSRVEECHSELSTDLSDRLRLQACNSHVSLATLCHVGWAAVVARASSRQNVVFGTVLFRATSTTDKCPASIIGPFENTLPLCVDVDDTAVEECLNTTHYRLSQLLEHEHASLTSTQPYSSVALNVPLFNALLRYRPNRSATYSGSLIDGLEFLGVEQRAHFPVTLTISDEDTTMRITAQISGRISPNRVCDYMQQSLESLCHAVKHSPSLPMRLLQTIPETERIELLQLSKGAKLPHNDFPCMHQLFEEQVVRIPDAVALVYEEQSITYADLNRRANRLAHQLLGMGVLPGERVALCMTPTPSMIAGLLAISKIGGTYVPIDPAYPSERMIHVLGDTEPRIILADEIGRTAIGNTALHALTVYDPNILPNLPEHNLDLQLTSALLAYIIYTSGSTGKPKGVMVEHGHIVRTLGNLESLFYFDEHDTWCLLQSIAFAYSMWGIWGALSYGCKIIIPSTNLSVSPHKLQQLAHEHGITILNLTPSSFKAFGDNYSRDLALDKLRYIFLSGERLDPRILRSWYTANEHVSSQVINMYGLTETPFFGAYKFLNKFDTNALVSPMGMRVPGLKLYLLDPHLEPVPIGAVGEIYIGGPTVARGYLNRPDLTSERFSSDPFNEALDSRVYRTGDMAYYSADGNLVYVSRNDQQVKIRGFRIEPCEVEACLVTHPAVRHALVIVVSNQYVDRLVAYVIAETVNNLTIALHDHASARLPSYMVPSAFIQLREFPLTQNGKIDRSALLKLDQIAVTSHSYEAPRGPVEVGLADIWGKLLGLKNVSRRDSFFELGGHSLLAVSIIEHMRALGWTLSMQNLFNHPILSDLADTVVPLNDWVVPANVITEDSKTLTPEMLPLIDLSQKDIDLIVAKVPGGIANIQDIYSLSPLQDGILFHNLLASHSDPYLVTSFVIFDNKGLLSRYLSAVQRMVDRHDILRAAFIWEELSTPAQVVWRNAPISITELTLELDEDSIRDQLSWESTHSAYRFNLEKAPLIRFVVTRATSGRWIALQIMHHLIGDETTVRMMHVEMQSHLNEKLDLLPPTPYRNLISNIRFEVNQEVHTKFFTEMLSEVDSSTLLFGLDKMHVDKSQVRQTSYLLDPNLVECLRRHAKNLNIGLATLSHVAWAVVLSRVCDQEKVVFGTVLSGRMHAGEGFDTAIGLYINTLPLLLYVDETSVETSLRKAHASLAQLVEHEYASLALAQRCSSLPTGTTLFNSLLNFRRYPSITDHIQYLQGIEFHEGIEYTNYPLTMSIDDSPDAVRLTAHVLRPICSDRLCAYTNQALESLVNALDTTPRKSIRLLEILPPSEIELLQETRITSGAVRSDELCVHQLFELQAEQSPNAIALVCEEQTLTYAELNTQANRLASKLMDLGVSPEQRIALCVARSPAMVVGLIAIMKSGAAYVPIDPAYPSERSAHILSDAKPSIALVDDVGRDALGEIIRTIPTVLDPNAATSFSEANATLPRVVSSSLAYIIYTSGSTGKPKGVMVEHRNIVRLFSGSESLVDFDRYDTWCLFHSIAFDVSVWELWGALSTGARLVIVPHHVSRSMQDVQRLLHEYNVTVLNLTPTAFRMFIEDFQNTHLSNDLRYILLAGERLDPGAVRSWYAVDKESVPDVVNMYGSTETTVHTTFKRLCKLDAEESVSPIGVCMPGKNIYLLDGKHRPVPCGVVGEIYISGTGVARGYLNRLDLTSERFLEDVYSDVFDSRMYRTGDTAYRLSDGSLAYVGRNDEQIKIRGFRIEPCEIEACLVTHPLVHQALVLVVSTEYVDRLVAYVIAATSSNLTAELYQHATARLPEYMVPSAFVQLAEFPLTQNGKIDRSALMKLDQTNAAECSHEAPVGPIETALADIWGTLLSLETIGRRDSFFALGGHSLLAIRIIEYMRALGWKLTAQNLFDHPVLCDLADTITKHHDREIPPNMITEECTTLTPDMLPLIDLTQSDIDKIIEQVPGGISNIQDIYALSPLQNGILFHNLLATERDPYIVVNCMKFTHRNLLDDYVKHFQDMVRRHDVLRTAFLWKELSVSAQVVWREAPMSITEVTLVLDEDSIGNHFARSFDQNPYRFDLEQAPLIRLLITRSTSGRWIALQLMHHLIGDETTARTMHMEMQARMNGNVNLPQSTPYRNLIGDIRFGVSQDVHVKFFTEMLADINKPSLPYALDKLHLNASKIDEACLVLSPDLVEHLNYHSRTMNIGLATLSHMAWALVISRICHQQQVVFGTVLSGRMHAGEGVDTAIGLYINTLPLRLDVDDTSVQQSLRRAHTRLAQLVDHEYASLALAQQCSGVASGIPLFSSILNFRQQALSEECIQYPAGIEFYNDIGQTNYPLSMLIDKSSDAIRLTAHVSHPFRSDRVCSYTNQALESLVSALDTTPQRAVHKLEILPNSEVTLLRETWNSIEALHPDELCMHQLFEEQVLQTPNAVALVYGDQTLTYAELNARANRLAHQLIQLGLVVDQHIALCVSRTPAMVIGLLAIMKAGGGYVPIDPAYSSDRSAYILNDAVPSMALVDEVGRNALGDLILTIPIVLDPNDEPHRAESNPIVPELTSKNLAYVIYTSGSTGKPKGVMVEHRSIVGLFNTIESSFHFDRHDAWCLVHSIAFDPSVWELWGALRSGARIVIAPQNVAHSAKELLQLVCERQVTVLNMTPAAFKLFTDNYKNTPLPNKLRYICLGGARLEPKILRSWYALCGNSSPQFVNLYGPTETTVQATHRMITKSDTDLEVVPIGKRLPGNKLYLLDVHGRPVPVGVLGEIHVGGSGVTRGYLKRPDLTRERFLKDPFADALDARMYRTGDTAYFMADGSLAYVGRNDEQVKFRDYRIEPGEIEACLIAHPAVTQALVLVVSHVNVDRIVAYVVAEDIENLPLTLHEHASTRLPEYMVPSAFVRLDEFRLTQNNKIDKSALPPLDEKAFARQTYEAPEGPLETMLAGIWCDLLGLQQVGRHDSFFALGGHSLLVIQMIQRLRSFSFNVNVRDLFDRPVLSRLAQILKTHHEIVVPRNLITPDTARITPDLLPLIDLTQSDIDQIIAKVTGGVANIQDIYALSPLQDGILFHNVLDPEHDPFCVRSIMATNDRNVLDRYLSAVQRVIDRHDIFRTAFVWEGLTTPAQIVWRMAPLSITEIVKSSHEEIKLAHDNFEFHMNLEKAPLISYVITRQACGQWILNEMIHHLIIDHATLEIMRVEIRAFIEGKDDSLPQSLPFRNLIAEVRLGDGQEAHKDFFTEMLGDVDEPTLPYGLADVHRDGSAITEYHHMLPSELNEQLRERAKDMNVSFASLCHVAYGLVLNRTSGQSKVVFGTVLFGRIGNNAGNNTTMGLFVNTLPLRIDVDETSLQTCLTDAHDRLAQLIEHEHASLALAQRCSSVADNIPLFSALLNFRHNSSIYDISDVILGMEYLGAEEHTNYPVTLSVEDYGSSLGLTAQVTAPICSERLCWYMEQALTSLASAALYTPNIQVRSLEILPVSEREELSSTRNTSRTEYTDLPCIHHLFERQAEQTPNATAIIYAQESVTYAELNARANRLAHRLIHLGLSPDERVAICTDRSPSMIVGCLAILKAGGAYVPIDPAYPSDRMSHILHDASPRFAVFDQLGLDAMSTAELAGLTVLHPDEATAFSDANPTLSNLSSTHLAYIIYTSGSTGKPKGVMVEHRNIVRLFCTTETLFHFDRHDTWCVFHSIAFDVSVWELWGALRSGARLMIAPHHVLRSPQEMQELLWEHSVSVLNLTPTAFKMFTDNYKNSPFSNSLRYIILAGEKFDPATLRSWYSLRDNSSPILVNMYGSTETTVHSTFAALTERHANQMVSVIGERLPDTRLYLLDSHGQLSPCGVTGEVYIGGAGVTRGYVNRSDLTQERFLADPFTDALDARMYRTGDTAYYLEDRSLAYVGRNDEQLKIRGFRVEPSEIEACLLSYPAVRQALVRVISTEHVDRLVAYVISAAVDNLADSLHEHARARLPEYMVPSAFVRLDAFPMTRNGKVDRSALPTLDQSAFACRSYEEPQGVVESAIAAIWSELLGLPKIGRHDSFFALGGHSLLAIRMIQRLRCLSLKVTVRELFGNPVLSSLAKVVKINQDIVAPDNRITADVTRITPDMLPLIDLTQSDIDRIVAKVPGGIANIQDIYALSPLQDGILFHNLLDSKYDPYCVLNRITATDRSILDGYLAAAQHVVDRHDILRTAFIWEGLTVPAQVVCRTAPLVVTEMAELPDTKTVDDQDTRYHTAEELRIDLEKAPLVRYVISRESSGRWVLNQVIHHLIIDHTTLDIMRSEIRAYLAGEENDLPKPLPFRNLVAEVRLGMSQEAHKNFFTEMLGDVDEPTLPFGVANVHNDGSAVTEYQKMLPSHLDDRLRSRAKNINVSLASLCHVAFALVLSKTSGQTRVVFGTVLFGRMGNNIGNDSTMGLFINTLPLRLDVDQTSVRACLKNAHNRLAQLIEHEHASLALAQRCSSVADSGPLFSALLNYRHNSPPDNQGEFIPGIEFFFAEERTNYPVTLSIEDYGSSLGLTAQVVPPICPDRLCAYVATGLESLVHAVESAQDIPMQLMEILPVLEFEELTTTRNAPRTEYADLPCIHHLFERQAEQSPNATAIIYAQELVTYAELNARANRLAHRLIHLGLSPDERVAICTDRSPSMIVGCLAILKAGGAYVPIDPAYPSDRMSHILHDASPRFAVFDQLGLDAMGTAGLAGLTVLHPDEATAFSDANPTLSNLSSTHLAYIIYTSGSTGKPKGVMVEHRNIARLFCTTETLFHFDRRDTWCLFHSIAFDVSVWELWGALRSGARLMIAPHHVLRSPQEMQELLWEHSVSVLNLTPTAFKMFTDNYKDNPFSNALRYIILAGEKFDPATLRSWYSLRDNSSPILVNMYGSTETTVHSTFRALTEQDARQKVSSIGKRIPDTKLYLLDDHQQVVPSGALGEIYIGGLGVTRGYLNRCDLTQERFLPDTFTDAFDARMYRTGDTAYYLPDNSMAYIGRNDQQLKIRGFRVESCEVEACLLEHPAVHQAIVLMVGSEYVDRLVAYVIADVVDGLSDVLHEHASARLPEYMVPSAFVHLDKFPLTQNGKIDRAALPSLDQTSFACGSYEEPQGVVEMTLANIWSELLGLQKIGRHDSFFALGGHSLLAIQMIQRLRCLSLELSIRELFDHPVLSSLARVVKVNREIVVPPNIIDPDLPMLTPDMLPLIDLTQSDIDRVIMKVPGGIANIQDIYALSPLQDGILFHTLLETDHDPYCVTNQIAANDKDFLERYAAATQRVIDRHDILRTAFVWEGLTKPAQVVWRSATLSLLDVTEIPDSTSLANQISRPKFRLDLEEAPLIRYEISRDTSGRWILNQLIHHLIVDHTTLEIMSSEIQAYLAGEEANLPKPSQFRNHIAGVRLGLGEEAHKTFFTEMLSNVDEPTLPFGVANVRSDGSAVTEFRKMFPFGLNEQLRTRARNIDVSLASLCHLAYALVLSRTSDQDKVVFGTVLFGRMGNNIGNDSTMGLFINTLPLRLDVDDTPVQRSLKNAHNRLAQLIEHEHASLAMAQRCSAVRNNDPLFSSLLNYRHNSSLHDSLTDSIPGTEFVGVEERTNYPVSLSVEDYASALGLTVQVIPPISSERLCSYMQQTLESLLDALQYRPHVPVRSLEVLPLSERRELSKTGNTIKPEYTDLPCIHHLFELQAERAPNAPAITCGQETLTYGELNARANSLAHQLIETGLSPDDRVAMCTDRSSTMIVVCLAILKAGGAYVPIDPAYPSDRMSYILNNAAPRLALIDQVGREALDPDAIIGLTVLDPNLPTDFPRFNPVIPNLRSEHLAYVIYTSGSTGKPKGVMVEHGNVVRLLGATEPLFNFHQHDAWCLFHSISFDVAVWELWNPLLYGANLVIAPRRALRSPQEIQQLLLEHEVTVLNLTPTALKMFLTNDANTSFGNKLRLIILAGERCDPAMLRSWYTLNNSSLPRLVNMYGCTETTVHATFRALTTDDANLSISPIGTAIPDIKLYLLDRHSRLVPFGAMGEIYLGGSAVARGYLNRSDLTLERFVEDTFSERFDARMYRTGDTAYYLPDGSLSYVGRNDQQVKIRGFRIEPCEVEACLVAHPAVHRALVLVVSNEYGDRLVAYVVAEATQNLAAMLQEHAAAKLPEYMVPSAFVRLDEFPMTRNGKVDLQSLPELDHQDIPRNSYEAPIGTVEMVIAIAWTDLLGIHRVSRYDHFFNLGGHSLIAVRLMNILAARGIVMTLNDLFQCPVLVDLASKIIQNSSNSSRNNVICVRRRGTELPLFFFPAGSGDFSYVFPLAEHIRSEFPIYILPWPSLRASAITSVPQLAVEIVTLMKSVQPEGPYRLAGYCSGGILTYCVAHLLSHEGESVEFVGLIDTYAPSTMKHSVFLSENYACLVDLIMRSGASLTRELQMMQQKVTELDFNDFIEYAQSLELYPKNVSTELIAQRFDQQVLYARMLNDYDPEKTSVELQLFRAADAFSGLSPSTNLLFMSNELAENADENMGWTEVVPESLVRLHRIPGNHFSMMDDTNNRLALAQTINSALKVN